MFYQLRNIAFGDICEFYEDQISFHDQLVQKIKKLQQVHLLFLTLLVAKGNTSRV